MSQNWYVRLVLAVCLALYLTACGVPPVTPPDLGGDVAGDVGVSENAPEVPQGIEIEPGIIAPPATITLYSGGTAE